MDLAIQEARLQQLNVELAPASFARVDPKTIIMLARLLPSDGRVPTNFLATTLDLDSGKCS